MPLVDEPRSMHFSPWQQTLRPVSGLLHGLYVFTVIHSFFGLVATSESLTSDERQFAISRRRNITDEVARVRSPGWTDSLSSIGRCLARRLFQCVQLQG